ncbi:MULTISPECIES: efflux RND transporter permease subunit [Bradyrhizobium]|uniref:Probale cation efflux system protein n=1 Tax=Bradyrhizobium diazoefficiens (strain JCM 10833 / BCRC 13528 / IAM 13628 / NBRC 14792 / USDA 110) TaxID=224911 RepID=Q89MT0_BRADU|nr:CusA/CzcA family heavy metal efflux RND transporter [Bradyrhizobium diazoefficiens]MBP1065901.1 cobalt-zinc-cadmium resistance protein CzcA [Bradyrhizobium japonicum]AND89411.1 cytochrome C peroxidase [Bradyrhizobium diazoefficiens USDA 110]PDT61057.1 CusA/CzcA family heavy metal efflux RND transporter [Bradyrhizobium diazoefficiens]QBP22880.1 CusA/CzcA family heavy metal efflux RND transporter [Bradyrhizobium diazoefficiens]WLA70465.1 CusA/CzcA family heavy metal efflux RND transporter [Br
MLQRLVAFALSQRLFVLLAVLLLIGAGATFLPSLPIDAFPDVSPVQVKIIMKAPGLTPEEVEQRITVPIELELLGLPNKKILRSTTKYALADVTIDFEDGTDIYWARNQVSERLSNIARDLPEGVSGGLAPITSPLGEMFMFTIDSSELSLAERRTLLDWVIRPALRTVPGVADVNALGGYVRAFEIVPLNDALAARGISSELFRRAVETNSRNDGAGRVNQGEDSALVRIEGSIRTIDDIKAIVVDTRDGVPIRVNDVARVKVGALTRYGAVTENGQGETVEGLVLGLRGANAGQLVRDVRAKLEELKPALPQSVSLNVFYDRSRLVGRAVGTVVRALGEATVLVVVLLLLFLGNWRASLVIALSLPLAIVIALLAMRAVGMSANLMSLGGLAIAIGMLIDALVVVVENIVGNLGNHEPGRGLPLIHVIFRSVCEVLQPVASGVLIIMIVFVPLLTLQGLEGKLFIPVALAIIFALAGSLLLALTVIPVATSFLLKSAGHGEPLLIRLAQRVYAPALDWSLRNERKVIAAALLALVAAGYAYSQLGKTFMPTMDEGDVIVSVETLPSVNLDESLAINARIQSALLKVPDVTGIIARTGSDELGLDPMGPNQTDTFLVLKPVEERAAPDRAELLKALRNVLADFPGISLSFTQPIDMRVQEMISGVRGDVAVKVFGSDVGRLNEIATKLSEILTSIEGAEDVYTTLNEGAQYYTVVVNRMEAGRLGLTVDTIANALRTQIEGRTIGTALEEGRRTPILVRGSETTREAPTLLASLPLTLASGQHVALSQVARIQRVDGPVKIDREDGNRMSVVRANVRGRDMVGFVEAAQRKVAADLSLPKGYRLTWGGQFENQQRAAARLSIVVPVAIGLIFVLLFTTFASVRQALLVLVNIPFALIGGVFALVSTGEYLSVPASVGFIALLGIAVLNGVVLVSYFNQLRAHGVGEDQIVVDGARRRLRPVLMTASITALGLIPLLFASGPGSEIQRPLAIVVIGGLLSSTLLTLILLPILYRRFGGTVKESK